MNDKIILELQALTDNKMLQILKKYLGEAFKRGYEEGYAAGELAVRQQWAESSGY